MVKFEQKLIGILKGFFQCSDCKTLFLAGLSNQETERRYMNFVTNPGSSSFEMQILNICCLKRKKKNPKHGLTKTCLTRT